MNLAEYQTLANRTAKDLPHRDALAHAAMGLAGEAGEFSDAIKKHLIYGQPLDFANAREELGDLLWFISYSANVLGFSLETVARMNIEKLAQRYPDAYTDYHAAARLDKDE